jgi:hypothetical protein
LKIAGRAIKMIIPSRLDMNTAIVVFVSATHWYRSASERRGLAVRDAPPGWLLLITAPVPG